MYVHTCCCTFIFVMSGFDLNSKESKNYLKTNLKKFIQKNKKEFISSLLHFLSIRPAGHSCPAGLAWPAGPFIFPPAQLCSSLAHRASPARRRPTRAATAAALPASTAAVPLLLTARGHESAPSPTSAPRPASIKRRRDLPRSLYCLPAPSRVRPCTRKPPHCRAGIRRPPLRADSRP